MNSLLTLRMFLTFTVSYGQWETLGIHIFHWYSYLHLSKLLLRLRLFLFWPKMFYVKKLFLVKSYFRKVILTEYFSTGCYGISTNITYNFKIRSQ
jgi:hypothetical protein